MIVEIWSDVMCPFCYLGWKNFQTALEQVDHKSEVQVQWRSFQLNPQLTHEKMDTYTYLSTMKGMPKAALEANFNHITQAGKERGIVFNFDKAWVVSTRKAHLFIQLSKQLGKASEVEELLFEAQFTFGLDVSDEKVLLEVAQKVGISSDKVKDAFNNTELIQNFNTDINLAQQIGIQGVPFFVFDRKYAVSGAQPVEVFVNTLNQVFAEAVQTGNSCNLDGECN